MNREKVIKVLKMFYDNIIQQAKVTGSPLLTRELVEYSFEDLLRELEIEVDELS